MSTKSWAMVAALAAAILAAAASEVLAAEPQIVEKPDDAIPTRLAERGVVSSGELTLPADLFGVPPQSDEPVDPVRIQIDRDRVVELVEVKRRTVGGGRSYIIGTDRLTPNSRFVFQLQDGLLRRGEIRLTNEVITLTGPKPTNGDIVFRMLIVDPKRIPEEREPRDPGLPTGNTGGEEHFDDVTSPESHGLEPQASATSALTIVKLMVVYTPAAKNESEAWLGDPIEETIDFHVFLANIGFENQAGTSLSLVHMQEVDYKETGDIDEDIERLACPCDHLIDEVGSNHLNEVFAPWKANGADIVSLWIESPKQSGVANIMSTVSTDFAPLAVNVVDWWAAFQRMTFDHEVGHNFGARHDRSHDNTSGSPYAFNHGFVNTSEKKVTIMAYESTCTSLGYSCAREPYWSDPTMAPAGTWGVATGPYAAHNALAVTTSASTVSGFDQKHNLVGCCLKTGTFWRRNYQPGPCP